MSKWKPATTRHSKRSGDQDSRGRAWCHLGGKLGYSVSLCVCALHRLSSLLTVLHPLPSHFFFFPLRLFSSDTLSLPSLLCFFIPASSSTHHSISPLLYSDPEAAKLASSGVRRRGQDDGPPHPLAGSWPAGASATSTECVATNSSSSRATTAASH